MSERLNSDVLLQIFKTCCDLDRYAPWTLSAICGSWKTLALEQPSLWTRITIDERNVDDLDHDPRNWAPLLACIRTWIKRSGTTLPLDIRIDLSTMDSTVMAPLGVEPNDPVLLIVEQSHRWRSFTYIFSSWEHDPQRMLRHPYDLDEDTILCKQKPLLQSIHLVDKRLELGPGVRLHYLHYWHISPETTPNLRSIYLENVIGGSQEIPWHAVKEVAYHVRDLHLRGGGSSLFGTVEACPNVSDLALSGYSRRGVTRRRLLIPHLQYLQISATVFVAEILSDFDMPSLRHLMFDLRRICKATSSSHKPDALASRALSDLAQKSPALLTVLVIQLSDWQPVPWNAIRELKTLEILRMSRAGSANWIEDPSFLQPLQTQQQDPTRGWCLPRLRSLTLETMSNDEGNGRPSLPVHRQA